MKLGAVVRRRRFRITTMQRGSDRVIAGVSSGVASALRIDPLIVRVGFVVLAIAGGAGVPLYFVLWYLMPGPDGDPTPRMRRDHLGLRDADLRRPLAIGLIVAGLVLLSRNVAPFFNDAAVWPLTLAGFGIAVRMVDVLGRVTTVLKLSAVVQLPPTSLMVRFTSTASGVAALLGD